MSVYYNKKDGSLEPIATNDNITGQPISITVTPTLSTGVKIAEIDAMGAKTNLYAPEGQTRSGKAVVIGDSYFDGGTNYNFANHLRSKNLFEEVVDYAEGGSGFGNTYTGHQTLYQKLQDSQMRADIANADVIYMHLGGNDILSAVSGVSYAVAEPDIYLRVQESLAEIYTINPNVTVYYIPAMDYKAVQYNIIRATVAGEKPDFLPSKLSKLSALKALLIHYMIYIGILNSALKIYCLDTPSCYLVEQLASDNMHPTSWAAGGLFDAFINGNYNCAILNMMVILDTTSNTRTVASGVSATFIQNYNAIMGTLITNRKVSKVLTWVVIPMIIDLSSDRIWFMDVPELAYGDSIYSAVLPYGEDDKIALLRMPIGLRDGTLTNSNIDLSPLNETKLPTTDGTYKLKVSHANGKPVYSWIKE